MGRPDPRGRPRRPHPGPPPRASGARTGAAPPASWKSPASSTARPAAAPPTAATCAPAPPGWSSPTSPPPEPTPQAPARPAPPPPSCSPARTPASSTPTRPPRSPPGVEAAIGTEALGRLRATWREFHAVADDDLRTRVTLARRWCRILGLDPDEAPPAPLVIKIPSELAKALARAIEILAEAVAADFAPPPPPFPPDAADKREHEKASRRNAERAAREVFGKRTRPRAITGTRDPREEEAAAARRLTRALRDATAGGRDTVTVTSKVPPGRLRMGKALAGKAQRAAGAVPTAEPFTSSRSRRVPAPPLRVGIACDISGSMGAFTGPVASAAWILARAAGHLPSARTASVLFGKGVYALTRPGETPAKVTDFTATASSESACRAIDALDGALDLASPGTARLLVIVSDTMFVAPGEPAGAQQRITRLHRAGCGVIILTPRGYAGICKYTDCQVIEAGDPADAIDAIARAATRALTA